MTIKAIETRYNGYRFRSRLEARWAVFFDTLNIKYEYEIEGFELPPIPFDEKQFITDHQRQVSLSELKDIARMLAKQSATPLFYLPDFWFPDFRSWGEVKGNGGIQDYEKMVRLVSLKNQECLLLRAINEPLIVMRPLKPSVIGRVLRDEIRWNAPHQRIEQAYAAARSARFEFGETPRSK